MIIFIIMITMITIIAITITLPIPNYSMRMP